jgi:transcriptional regulator PpsR
VIEAVGAPPALARFFEPERTVAGLDAAACAALVAASADVALVLDAKGVVLDVAFSDADLAKAAYREWVGRRWAETVTVESRPKLDDLLREASSKGPTRWRQVNHPVEGAADVPVRYSAMRFGADRRLLAVGRDMRALASAQKRLAEAQQAMEREYARIRNAEKRYRLLFQMASEAVLIVDAGTWRVLEANGAAAALFGADPKRLTTQTFQELFAERSRPAAQSFLAAARVAPRVDNVHVELARNSAAVLISGSLFRHDAATHLIVLVSSLSGAGAQSSPADAQRLSVVEAMPEAFVVTDADRRILTANAAFLELVQVASAPQVRGELLERWIGRPGVDLDVLFSNLRTHGAVRHFSTVARGEFGATEDVEVAAVAALDGAEPCYGLTLRNLGWRAGRERLGGRELPRTVEQFTDLVGRVPLKNLVRETTDLIERLCIEAALEMTRDNRASAAEMLGLSRQGFYAKLRRYGLGDLDGLDTEGESGSAE